MPTLLRPASRCLSSDRHSYRTPDRSALHLSRFSLLSTDLLLCPSSVQCCSWRNNCLADMEDSTDSEVADWDGRAYSRSSELTCSTVERADQICRMGMQFLHRCLALSPMLGGVVLSSAPPPHNLLAFFPMKRVLFEHTRTVLL
jgi:hypothetical protein